MSSCIFLLLLLPAWLHGQQDQHKSKMAGWAIQAGTGATYGGIGILVENQILLKENLRLTPNYAMGFSLGGTDSSKAAYYWLNFAGGIQVESGSKHRLLLGTQLLACVDFYNKPDDAPLNKKVLIGPSFFTGYKGTSSFGLIWQIMIGIAYIQHPLIPDHQFFFEPHSGVGIGYKF